MIDSSLLSYLGGFGGPFRIELSPDIGEVRPGSVSGFPFEIVSDAGALARVIGARVISDAGSTVKTLFLMLSPDDHARLEDASNILSNADIESLWEQAFDRHSRLGSLIPLSSGGRKSQRVVSFRSLFYCTRTRLFFHPPCPDCGEGLALCRDDTILAESGLKPYSSSLRRYLYCPVCRDKGASVTFYSSRPDAGDPGNVKGPDALMTAFGKLAAGDLPCIRCPEHASCYTRGLVLSSLVPVAFYPFFLLVLESGSLNASDYLALVSGARCEELEKSLADQGRFSRSRMVSRFRDWSADLTLFAGEEKEFLEILFLKLSFLEEAARYLLTGESGSPCKAFGPSIRTMWLELPQQGGLLPAFWGPRLTAVEWDLSAPGALELKASGTDRQALGNLWFHALLENRAQDSQAVHEALHRALDEKRLDASGGAFAAGNIFWEPRPAPRKYAGYWRKALRLGSSLLAEGGGHGYPVEELLSGIQGLQREIRSELLSSEPGESEAGRQTVSPDELIGLALGQIMSRWRESTAGAEEKHPVQSLSGMTAGQDASPDIEATVVLAGVHQPASPHVEGEPPENVAPGQKREAITEPAAEEEDFRTETVIIRSVPDAAPAVEPAPPDRTVVLGRGAAQEMSGKAGQQERKQDVEATVVMKPTRQAAHDPERAGSARHDDDLMTQTVVMDAGSPFEPASSVQGKSAPETVILGKVERKQSEPALKDDDLMAETVVIGDKSLGTPVSRSEEDVAETVILGNPGRKMPEPVQAKPSQRKEDRAAETVVLGPGASDAPALHREEDPAEATVVLGPSGRKGPEPQPERPSLNEGDLFSRTVVPGARGATASRPGHGSESVSETVVLGAPDRTPPEAGQVDPAQTAEKPTAETVILSAPGRKPVPPQKSRPQQKEEDAMAETIIMGTPAVQQPRQAEPSAGDDDGLEETVIMTPDRKGR